MKVLCNLLTKKEFEIINKYKDILIYKYPEYIDSIILFGSKARGESKKDSDIDLLITLKKYDWKIGDQIRRNGYELDEEIDFKFSIFVVPYYHLELLEKENIQFGLNIKNDGIRIW